jgi:hypothetical protein
MPRVQLLHWSQDPVLQWRGSNPMKKLFNSLINTSFIQHKILFLNNEKYWWLLKKTNVQAFFQLNHSNYQTKERSLLYKVIYRTWPKIDIRSKQINSITMSWWNLIEEKTWAMAEVPPFNKPKAYVISVCSLLLVSF